MGYTVASKYHLGITVYKISNKSETEESRETGP